MRGLMVGVLMLTTSGCGAMGLLRTDAKTPPGEGPEMRFYAHAAKYELLRQVSAKECASTLELKDIGDAKSPDPRALGPGALFERAKFEAIRQAKDADGLIGLRARLDADIEKQCITVEGRAYRITAIEATPGVASGSRQATAARHEGDATLAPVFDADPAARRPETGQ